MDSTNLKQFLDSQTCLECKGCCRFRQKESQWRPKLMKKEADFVSEELVDKDLRIKSVVLGDQYICSFLDEKTSLCRKYVERPLECALYPFVLVKKGEDVFVAAHLACPFVLKYKGSQEFVQYASELKDFFENAQDKPEIFSLAQTYLNADQELDILFSI